MLIGSERGGVTNGRRSHGRKTAVLPRRSDDRRIARGDKGRPNHLRRGGAALYRAGAAYNGVCSLLVTEDGAPVPEAAGAVRAGAPLRFPTETIKVSSSYAGPNIPKGLNLPDPRRGWKGLESALSCRCSRPRIGRPPLAMHTRWTPQQTRPSIYVRLAKVRDATIVAR
jgi:hypothetical protein